MGVSTPLFVKSVQLCEEENAKLHHTHRFKLVTAEPATPVLRRGQPFKMTIRFDRPFNIETDIVRFSVSFGRNPNAVKGTKAVCSIPNEKINKVDSENWNVSMIASSAEDLTVEVHSPVDSPVGVWKLEIETAMKNSKTRNNYRLDRDVYLLYNPWVKEDLVYMEDQKLLEEYVSSDVGKIWVSNEDDALGKDWVFGQFEACVLPVCELMLGKSGIDDANRGDPIKVSRAIAKIVNSYDDYGVVVGNWSTDFSGGTKPFAWTGSVPILEQFLETLYPVKYGQCWVYAGVVNTVCRALGIPSRVVTTLNSAHDKNASLSIDRYYDANMERMRDPSGKSDSIWNFHVWNDVWMARPDLPKGYGGWQAIDATPQEKSDGVYQCGPASVEAIRQGAVGHNYDVPCVLAAVNADVIDWIKDKSDFGWKKIESDQKRVGNMILTKAPLVYDPYGEGDRENIVSQYKNVEGSLEERLSLYRAARYLSSATRYYSIPSPDKETVKFKLSPLEKIEMGDSFTVTVNVDNKSNIRQTIEAILSAESVYYNGVKGYLVKSERTTCSLEPGKRDVLRLIVTADEYSEKLVEYSYLKLRAIATVVKTGQTWAGENDFQISQPNIVMEIDGRLIIGEPATVLLSFKNPLKKTLTGCKFNIAGSKSMKNRVVLSKDAAPGDLIHVKLTFIPQETGDQKIFATFTCDQFVDAAGSIPIKVYEKEER